jgi:hypothetical protein
MKHIFIGLFFISSFILSQKVVGQRTDSTMIVGGITGDTLYLITENIPKSKFWGNSWYSGITYNLSKSNEFTLNLGRTYGNSFSSGGGFNLNMKSWGIGYSRFTSDNRTGQTISAFGEVSNFFLPPATARLDYLFDFVNNAHYVRPSIGINLVAFDIMYNYSFKLYGKKNLFRHGLIIRFKYFINNKNWQKVYPHRC